MTVNKTGLVLRKYSGFYYVQDDESDIYECKLRGKVKTQVLSGDWVRINTLGENKGILEEVLPRDNELMRPRIANVDLVLIVLACSQPVPTPMLLDRLLFLAFFNKITPYIILNKCDLTANEIVVDIQNYYPKAGFKLIKTSAVRKKGIEELKQAIDNKIAVFSGPSGVGKSSLLNALLEGIDVKTQEVSKKVGRGKHTTRHVELYSLNSGGWIADTPGFSVLDLPPLKSPELPRYFPDFAPYAQECRFSNCLHYRERDCEVKQAVENGIIPEFRYKNYIAMLEEVMTNERCYR